jgi:type IV secretory pathway TrbL component
MATRVIRTGRRLRSRLSRIRMKMTKKRRFAIILLGGAAIIAGCAIGGTVQLAGTITSATPQPIPGRFQESLGSGQWEIYQLTGTQSGVSAGGVSVNVTHFGPPSLAASMVTITSASGAQVTVQNQSGNSTQTIQKGSPSIPAWRPSRYRRPGTTSCPCSTPVLAPSSSRGQFSPTSWLCCHG